MHFGLRSEICMIRKHLLLLCSEFSVAASKESWIQIKIQLQSYLWLQQRSQLVPAHSSTLHVDYTRKLHK